MAHDPWEDAITHDVRRVLTPVSPSPMFRDHLRTNLQLASQQQAARRAISRPRAAPLNYWLVTAAVISITLAAGGVVAWALRTRFPSA